MCGQNKGRISAENDKNRKSPSEKNKCLRKVWTFAGKCGILNVRTGVQIKNKKQMIELEEINTEKTD